MRKIIQILLVCNLFLIQKLQAQTVLHTDTVNIYKYKAGVRFKIYMRHWFFCYDNKNRFGWTDHKDNLQDSMVIWATSRCYFKVYRTATQLLMEVLREGNGSELTG